MKYYIIGIKGSGTSTLANLLYDLGNSVCGYDDVKDYKFTMEGLNKRGINIYYDDNLPKLDLDTIVTYTKAISLDHPELVRVKNLGLKIISYNDLLGEITKNHESICVCGTHGKTTTTSMVSLILEKANLNPTILVGGILNEFQSNVVVGKSKYFITEACEYMDSFLSLKPFAEIILNIDEDHLDYFKNINHIEESFREFASHVPDGGFIVAYDANPYVKMATQNVKCEVVTFGLNESSNYYAKNISFNELIQLSTNRKRKKRF